MNFTLQALRLTFFIAALTLANICHAEGVEYFGFFNGDLHYEDNILLSTPAVTKYTNTLWISDLAPNEIKSDIQFAVGKGLKSIVDLGSVFFPISDSGHPEFDANWQVRWRALVTALNSLSESDLRSIAAFYPIDEPNVWNILPSDILTVLGAIRTAFPGVPVAVTYRSRIDEDTVGYFDWVGINCYSNGLFNCDGKSYTFNYAFMKQRLNPNQRIFLMPQVGFPTGNSACCVKSLIQENQRLYELAYGDAKVIGIFPFAWQNMRGWLGLNGIPLLQAPIFHIGNAVTSKWAYPVGIAPVYRFTSEHENTDHLFTLNALEGLDVAITGTYNFEGFGFNVYTNKLDETHPLYQCKSERSGSHFVGVSCDGATQEVLLGYVSDSQTSTTVPLYRFFNPRNDSRLVTVDYSQGIGLRYEGIQGYSPSVAFM